MQSQQLPSILAISSHVIRGSVGLRAAAFAMETLGHDVWSIPTVILPWHPGQGKSTRSVEGEATFASMIDDMIASHYLDEIDGILTGYMGAAYQVQHVQRLIEAIKLKRPDVKYLCDPVIGDDASLYVDEAIAQNIKNQFLPLADVITPNRFELAWLSGESNMGAFQDNQEIIEAARGLSSTKVLVTSAYAMMRGNIGNLMVDGTTALLAEHRQIPHVPNGLGDLKSALFLARILQGQSDSKALEQSTATVFEISHRSAKVIADELQLQQNRDSLLRPMAQIMMRNCV
jgi:pyridoxine kinase